MMNDSQYWYKNVEVNMHIAILQGTNWCIEKFKNEGWEFIKEENGPDDHLNGYNPNHVVLYFRRQK